MANDTHTMPLRLGFGATGAWGKSWFSAQKAERLVTKSLELGITHFDTAGFYANGRAETRLGAALKLSNRTQIEISSKVGTHYRGGGKPIKDFSVASIRRDVHASLKRLNRDYIDIVYLHGPTPQQIDSTRNVMSMLKQEGKIRAIGVCGVGEQLSHAVETKSADVIMGLYNAFDTRHSHTFKHAKQNNIRTVGIAPLGQALYRRGFMRPKSPADLWYLARAVGRNRAELRHARKTATRLLSQIEGRRPAAAMLGFTLANPDLDIVLVNTTRPEHLEECITTAKGPELAQEALSLMRKLERNHV